MGLFRKLNLTESPTIDWEMNPEYTFGTFESWGGKERVRSGKERIYYFFIDNWVDTPKLCLMERGIKHAKVVAEILAPQDMVDACVAKQGSAVFEKNFAIDDALKAWLLENILETDDESKIIPLVEETIVESALTDLPGPDDAVPSLEKVSLPSEFLELSEDEIKLFIEQHKLFDKEYNEGGSFENYLIDNGDGLTVTDKVTGLMWQRGGTDIMSHRMMSKEIVSINDKGFAGFNDWRQPSLAEALSLMQTEKNSKGLYLDYCFSIHQPFIFVNATRKTGGYWFVDYKQGKSFWASGTIPGAFGRLVRQEK